MVQTRVTCDVSTGGKVKAHGVTPMIQHWARDVDARNGIYRPHSNEGIDAARSINNETWFPTDGPRSTWMQPGSVEEIRDRLEDRLATVTGRTRSDSVVMRGVVLGLSSEWVEEEIPNWKTDPRDRAKFMDTLQPVVERVIEKAGGPQNVILVTGHFDEVVPQIQMAVTPVTEDGRLRQNDFDLFKSPGSLRKLHKQMREELKASGVDVILESSERSREHLSNHEYARKADKERAEEIAALVEERQRQQDERADLNKERRRLDAERKSLDEEKAAWPKQRQQAREQAEFDGYVEGREEADAEALATIQEAERQARDIVRQAQETLRRLRDENERLKQENGDKRAEGAMLDATLGDKRSESTSLDAEISRKRGESEILEEAFADKRKELHAVVEQIKEAESSRDNMPQFDSDFLDEELKDPEVRERYEEFKIGRVKGYPAAIDGTKEYYERTVAENKRRTKPKGGGNGQPQGQGQLGGGKGKPKGGGKGGGNGQLGE